jgi:heptosyltransferase II
MNNSLRIFIEIPTWLGDAVMVTPAVENIIQNYPTSKLIIFGSFIATKLFVNHPNLEKIIIDDSKKECNRYINLYKLAKHAKKVDIAFSFRTNFTTSFLLFFIDAKEKYNYKRLDKQLNTHQVIRYNDFINKSLSSNTFPDKLKIYKFTKKAKNSKPILGLNPGSTYGSAKRWYPQEFAKVAIELSTRYDIKIFGGPSETEIAGDIEQSLKNAGIFNYQNLAGKTSVEELIENISNLDIFITNDSGPMHVAAAFSIPTVAIFGPTRYAETNQWKNENEMLLRKDVDCSPCMQRVCPIKDKKEHHKCMKLITADDVFLCLKEESII